MTREALEAQLLLLPSEERAYLARVLIESLDDQPELDPSWLQEAQRRAAEFASGGVQAVPAPTALVDARRKLAG